MGKLINPPSAGELKSLYFGDNTSTIGIGAIYGVGATTVKRWFDRYGISIRAKGCPNPLKPSAIELKRLYIDERQSSADLAIRFNCTFCTICKWLKEYGIQTRSFSEAQSLKMSQRTYEEKLRNSETSRNTLGFKSHSPERKAKAAHTVMLNGIMSDLEYDMYNALIIENISCVPQYAVNIYNIDFATPELKLAIEVDGGNWHHNHIKKVRQDKIKTEYLEANGWTILRFTNWRNPSWIDDAIPLIRLALEQLSGKTKV